MRTMKLCLLVSIALGLTACIVNPRFRMPSAEEIRTSIRAEVVDDLELGRAIAIADCADCHRVYWPAEYSAKEWPRILEEMGERSSLTREEVEALTEYMTHASDLLSPRETRSIQANVVD